MAYCPTSLMAARQVVVMGAPECKSSFGCLHYVHHSGPQARCSISPKPVQGGTRAAPSYFNDRNREEPANYWPSASGCDYVVSLRDEQGALLDTLGEAVEPCRHGRSSCEGPTTLGRAGNALSVCAAAMSTLAPCLQVNHPDMRNCP